LGGQETVDTIGVGNRLFSVVAVPVFVEREIIGALALGIQIGDAEAQRLSRLTHSQVAFLTGDTVAASTVATRSLGEKCLNVFDSCLLPVKAEPPAIKLTEIVLEGQHYFGITGRFESLASDQALGYVLLSSYEQSLQALKKTQLVLLEVSLCAILAGFSIVSWVITRVTRPLRELRDSVEAVGRGDFSRRLEIQSGDECGELAQVYNDMAENLKRSQEHLEQANVELVESSRRAGMAEVATGVLHNVRNVMTTVNVASALVADRVNKSKSGGLARLVNLLRQHESDLATFLTQDAKGKQVIDYLAQLSEHFANEQKAIVKEIGRMQECIEHMKDVVQAQQSYAKTSGEAQKLKVAELVEDALRMNPMTTGNIQLIKELPLDLAVKVEKHKALQILVNLIRNGKQACESSLSPVKTLTVRAANGGDRVRIAVIDNGIGIASDNLNRIFSHGFTTKKEGHGFGLHHSAAVAKEMGGALLVESAGEGKGATFILELPALSQS
jgi:signal transduction histidine kinase